MNYLGIEYSIKNVPVLDDKFIPFGVWMREYLKEATNPIAIAVEREDGLISVRESAIRGPKFAEANLRYVERLVKFTLWSTGGFRVYLRGCRRDRREAGGRLLPRGRARLRLRLLRGRLREAARGDRLHRGDLPRRQRVRQGHRRAHGGAAASASMRAVPTARSPRSSTESRCTPRRSCGSRRSPRIPSTISTRS